MNICLFYRFLFTYMHILVFFGRVYPTHTTTSARQFCSRPHLEVSFDKCKSFLTNIRLFFDKFTSVFGHICTLHPRSSQQASFAMCGSSEGLF